jgi:phage-related tail fiber protein
MLQFSPNLIATADINPYAIVKMSTTAFSGSASTAAADYVVGVADGSTRRFDSSVHAAAGDPISLQPSNCVQLKCGASTAITAGLGLIASTAGVAITAAGSGNVPLFVALEAAAVDTIFWAYRLPSVKPL